ncbi:hypothetical protein ACSCB1_44900 [Streptomyces europaeiscabiei]|uniref:hypothetical protein n=1 Tax=Streptomyces europaeiscabiei TaxID=146819 RepID=UPI0006284D8B|nr:hypothetical protein [Streptomyces europaeiscabiei]MDX2765470.1 hypothetical protein [Streptomyces europaeiscabiei]MDX2772418.1 hypothetical protein [Streptomyces europaeiscabiei]MDX3709817.1 hypothetical protein [Streptomyces europaeiscabiei]MDX3782191.1 hypothetical protein [Streptomyces europaeiscabiei]MDX3861368.1 hypothetical protein [Streptomyces europaeiscabiei]
MHSFVSVQIRGNLVEGGRAAVLGTDRGARWKTFGTGPLLTAAVVLVFALLLYAAAPAARSLTPSVRPSSGSATTTRTAHITGVLVLVTALR